MPISTRLTPRAMTTAIAPEVTTIGKKKIVRMTPRPRKS